MPLCVCHGEPCSSQGPELPPSSARDFSLLIRECEEFRSASIHFSVLPELFDEPLLLPGVSFSTFPPPAAFCKGQILEIPEKLMGPQ